MHPAADVYAAMVDKAQLTARLEQLGGPGALVLEHRADSEGARYTLRHGLSSADLPPAVAALMSGDVFIERTETLRPDGASRYTGDVSVTIKGTPASAIGSIRLADLPAVGSELRVTVEITVRVPLFGAKIEQIVAEQITQLLDAETRFTLDWLARQRPDGGPAPADS